MPWLQICFHSTAEHAEMLEEALLENGAVSVTVEDGGDQALLEPAPDEAPLWEQIKITGLFSADNDPAQIISALQEQFDEALPAHDCEILEDKDWQREWMKHYHPMRFGERLWICPSWTPPPDPEAINLLLDPGLAFGTGTHATTALCLNWLDGHNLSGKTLVDYGCGSGILAIAALLLGAEHVVALDYDPQALQATKNNAERNSIDPQRLSVLGPDEPSANPRVDIVIANILSGTLINLRDTLIALMKPNAALVLSGILDSQASAVQRAYKGDIDFEPDANNDGWSRLSGRRRAS